LECGLEERNVRDECSVKLCELSAWDEEGMQGSMMELPLIPKLRVRTWSAGMECGHGVWAFTNESGMSGVSIDGCQHRARDKEGMATNSLTHQLTNQTKLRR